MKNFIPIPTDFYKRPEAVRLMIREHCSGVGAYILILTYLRDCENYRCSKEPEEVAFAANIVDIKLCERVINNYNLFEVEDEDFIFSPWLRQLMKSYDETREKRRAAGRASAAARKEEGTHVQHMFNTSPANIYNKEANVKQQKEQSPTIIYNNNNNDNDNKTNKTNKIHGSDFGGAWAVKGEELDRICRCNTGKCSTKIKECILARQNQNHNCRLLIEIIEYFGMGDEQSRAMAFITKFGEVGGQNFMDVIGTYKSAKKEGFKPRFPLNFILPTIQSYNI